MKKWIYIILALVIISGASIYAYQALHQAQIKVGAFESIVPDKAILYLYSYNLDNKIIEFRSSQFFQQVSSSKLYKKFIEPGLTKFRQDSVFISDLLFKKDAALAVLSFGEPEGSGEGKKTNVADILLLLRVESKLSVRLKKELSDFYLRSVAKDGISFKNYSGIKITSYKFPQGDLIISYAILGDVIIFGSIEGIQKSIDLFKQKNKDSLANDVGFQKLAPKIEKDSLFWGYCNYKNYNKELVRVFVHRPSDSDLPQGANRAASLMQMKPFVELASIFEGTVFYLDYDSLKDGFIMKTYGSFNKKAADSESLLDVIASQKRVDKKQLNLVPKDAIVYCGGNYDLLNYWRFLKKFLFSLDELYKDKLANASFEHSLKMAESFLGVDIERDILASLGSNQGFAFVNINSIDFGTGQEMPVIVSRSGKGVSFPFPQIYAFLEFNDEAKLRTVMQSVSEHAITNLNKIINAQQQQGQAKQVRLDSRLKPQPEEKEYLKLKIENYNGIDLYIIDMLEGFSIEQLRLNYCFLDNYMLISISPQLTKKIIDLSGSNYGSLNSNFEFKRAMDKMLPDYSTVLFFDFSRLMRNIKETGFINQLKKESKDFSGETIDELLDILSNISTFASTQSLSDSGTSEASIYIKVKGL